MSQTVILPSKCLGCKSERMGVDYPLAVYACGTTLRHIKLTGRLKVSRTRRCITIQEQNANI